MHFNVLVLRYVMITGTVEEFSSNAYCTDFGENIVKCLEGFYEARVVYTRILISISFLYYKRIKKKNVFFFLSFAFEIYRLLTHTDRFESVYRRSLQ